MTITDLIPALKGHGRRRAVDEVERLRERKQQLETALGEAGDEVALLRWDLAVAHHKLDEAEGIIVTQLANLDDLHAEVAALRARLAAEANATAITVPPMVRPIDGPEDEATAPIDVRPLREAAAAGLLQPATNPGRI